jgi:hypothetical protein
MKINGEIFTKEEELEIAVKLMKKDTQWKKIYILTTL